MGSPSLYDEQARALLSRNIVAPLEDPGISQNELARRSNVSQKQVNNIVQERTGCGIDALSAIAKVALVEPWLLLLPEFSEVVHDRRRFTRAVHGLAALGDDKRIAIEVMLGK